VLLLLLLCWLQSGRWQRQSPVGEHKQRKQLMSKGVFLG
jgi:hypothetical protein